ncbi:MAG: radical SAM family heme chaperone HemW [Nitrospiraceae bacterium]
MDVGLYIHVPFCRTRCHFCAFYLQIHREDRAQAYVQSLQREIRLHAARNTTGSRPLGTVYLGGGTPTTLTSEQLSRVLAWVRTYFGVEEDAELTIEGHPDTVTGEELERLAEAGFNRISFGLESMDNEELRRIGRSLDARRIHVAVRQAREAGFVNLNLDLIYGLPGQSLDSWRSTLDQTIALDPTHVSCYALTVEERTRLHVDLVRGTANEPDPVLQNAMEDEAEDRLARAGYERYEISNYCRPGYACRHNLGYWKDGDYLGLGPSAQSYVNGCRFGNVEDLALYHDTLESGRLPILEHEQLNPERQRREALVFGLRLTDGIDLTTLGAGPRPADVESTLNHLIDRGLLDEAAGRIRLTAVGRRFADSVAVELL